MSPDMVTAIGGVLVLVLGAVGLLLQQVLKQVGKLVESTREIHDLTNGAATESKVEMRALRDKIELLHEQIANNRQAAADVRSAMEGRGDQ